MFWSAVFHVEAKRTKNIIVNKNNLVSGKRKAKKKESNPWTWKIKIFINRRGVFGKKNLRVARVIGNNSSKFYSKWSVIVETSGQTDGRTKWWTCWARNALLFLCTRMCKNNNNKKFNSSNNIRCTHNHIHICTFTLNRENTSKHVGPVMRFYFSAQEW